jgi:hypothetical protein
MNQTQTKRERDEQDGNTFVVVDVILRNLRQTFVDQR